MDSFKALFMDAFSQFRMVDKLAEDVKEKLSIDGSTLCIREGRVFGATEKTEKILWSCGLCNNDFRYSTDKVLYCKCRVLWHQWEKTKERDFGVCQVCEKLYEITSWKTMHEKLCYDSKCVKSLAASQKATPIETRLPAKLYDPYTPARVQFIQPTSNYYAGDPRDAPLYTWDNPPRILERKKQE
jgi:hypothetical protein